MKSRKPSFAVHWLQAIPVIGLLATCLPASGAMVIANTPLYASVGSVPPNLAITVDDSGSMGWAYVPDSIGAYATTNRFKSWYFNALYYNPSVVYTPPPKYNGSSCSLDNALNPSTCYSNESFTAAHLNGLRPEIGSTINLSTAYYAAKEYPQIAGYSAPYDTYTGQANAGGDPALSSSSSSNLASNYTCTLTFDRSYTGSKGALRVSSCTGSPTPATPFLTSNIAVGNSITVTGSTYPGTYTVDSIVDSKTLVLTTNFAADQTNKTNVGLSWSTTVTTTTTTYPAYYYRFWNDGATPAAATTTPTNCDGTKDDDDCYILVRVGSSNDIAAGSTANKQQNFANWFSFYRSRTLSAASGIMRAFATVDSNVRIAWQGLSTQSDKACGGFSTACEGRDGSIRYDSRMRALGEAVGTKTHKQEFYEWLANQSLWGGTPTIAAMDRAGRYFQLSTTTPAADHPLAETPPTTAGTFRTCRINYSLLITDGGWCSDTTSSTTIGDDNSAAVTLPVEAPIGGSSGSGTTSWTPGAPYRDGQGYNLADIAFYFWRTPMKAGITYNVQQRISDPTGTVKEQWLNPRNDPATWLHLNSFTVGLGMKSTMTGTRVDGGTTSGWASGGSLPVWGGSTFAGDYSKLMLGTGCPTSTTQSGTAPSPYCWPATKKQESCAPASISQQYKVYDMWHSAIASRGQFFSADSPQEIADSLTAVLAQVQETHGSASALAANSAYLNTSTMVFQAKMDTTSWYGKLLGHPVNINGSTASPAWDAASYIPEASIRKVYTYPGPSASPRGVAFDGASNCTTNFSSAQIALLNADGNGAIDNRCTDRINWLRGDHSKEIRNSGGYFRNRVTDRFMDEDDVDRDDNRTENRRIEWVLGDIVNSDPVYVQKENLGYAANDSGLSSAQKTSYLAFLNTKLSRTSMLYVGANDGMLHAINAKTSTTDDGGKEVFAYVPAGVYEKLSKLTDTTYTHQFYVDGSPSFGDAYIGGAWKTILVGGLNAGGKSIYALDITNPDSFSASKVLWEYKDTDLGYTFSQPRIVRLNNGSWAAIFGNGYNSNNSSNGNQDKAFLYIVDLETGALIKKIAAGSATNNGLSTLAIYDSTGDRIVDKVYAGDLQGNLWKFDLSSSNVADWALGNGGQPLYATGGPTHPITTGVALGTNTLGGVMVYFGTGRYLTASDATDTTLQTFYGIWDKDTATDNGTVASSSLVSQTITSSTTTGGYEWRLTSNNAVNYTDSGTTPNRRGWRMELTPVPGERVLSTPQMKFDRVVFTTVIPSTDPCTPGGTSWLMELNAATGSYIAEPVFDINGDKTIDANDKISGVPPSGVKLSVGAARPPVWLSSRTISAMGIPGTDAHTLGDNLGGLTTGSNSKGDGVTSCTSNCTTTKMLSGTEGSLQAVQNSEPADPTPPAASGSKRRVYWRQIQ